MQPESTHVKEDDTKGKIKEFKALKMLKYDQKMDGFPITSLREILILKKLKHKNIVSLEDVFHKNNSDSPKNLELRRAPKWYEDNQIYMVFEHLPHDLMGLVDSAPKWNPAQLKCVLK